MNSEPEHISTLLATLQAAYKAQEQKASELTELWAACRACVPEPLYNKLSLGAVNPKTQVLTIYTQDQFVLCEIVFFQNQILDFFNAQSQKTDPVSNLSIKKIQFRLSPQQKNIR